MTDIAPAAAETVDNELFSAIVPLTHVDVRDPSSNPDNTWTMSGYAAVFNQQAVYLDSKFLQVVLEIDPRAFDDVLTNQGMNTPQGAVHFNLGHDMNRAVAATNVPAGQPGSLQLSADAHGLRYLAKVSKDDPDGVAMAVKMRDGVIAQASMAFVRQSYDETVTENAEGPDVVLQRITGVKALYDVCACPQGVFSQTVSQLQQFAAGYPGQPGALALSEAIRVSPGSSGGAPVISAAAGGGTVQVSKPRLDAATLAAIREHTSRR